MRLVLTLIVGVLIALSGPAFATGTLERVRESGEFKIGYRSDAVPFSFTNDKGEITGYAVRICRRIAAQVKQRLSLDDMKIKYVQVNAENRFEKIQSGEIDILCGPTTVTLSRRKIVDFSLFTFIDGASVMYLSDGPTGFEEIGGKKIGVRAGTTTEKSLQATLKKMALEAEIMPVADHADGLKKLEAKEISAYFADQAILLYLATSSKNPSDLRLTARTFSVEPYALAFQLGDSEFRLVVDTVLSRLYRSGRINQIFKNSFGDKAKPSDLVNALYLINRLPR